MLKTIKINKQMRLDELIKNVWDNSVNEKRVFLGNHGQRVVFDNVGGFYPSGYAYSPDSTFTVEIEEPITDVTLLEKAVYVHKNETLVKDFNTSIDEILIGKHEGSVSKIYALIDGRLELVWEGDGE